MYKTANYSVNAGAESDSVPLKKHTKSSGGLKLKKKEIEELIKKFIEEKNNKEMQRLSFPLLFKDKLPELTSGTLSGGGETDKKKRGRPKKVKADSDIKEILEVYEKDKEIKSDEKDNKKKMNKTDKKHKADMKKLLNGLEKYKNDLSDLIEKHKNTLEGGSLIGGSIFDDLADLLPSIAKHIPIVGDFVSSGIKTAADLLDPYRQRTIDRQNEAEQARLKKISDESKARAEEIKNRNKLSTNIQGLTVGKRRGAGKSVKIME